MPQGSVVGPFGFPIYSAPVASICRKHGISCHFYADDSQLYLAFDPQDEDIARLCMEACISEIREWLRLNHLKLNDSKTEFMVMGSPAQLKNLHTVSLTIGGATIASTSSARNIGALFDSSLSMKDHVNALSRTSYCHIRTLGKIRRYLTKKAAVNLVHAFVSSRLDQMNSLLFGIPKYLVQKLQKIQNNAARIVSRAKRRDHITPVLKDLHWLPVQQRIEFKIVLLVFKAQTGLAPGYLRDLLVPYQPPRALRSIDLSLLKMPRSRTKTYGDRSFEVAGPRLWNKLPHDLRRATELEGFKTALKSHLFKQTFE